jgi:hypothetical protein
MNMSNVISFLERMGQDSELKGATPEELESALTRAQIDPAMRAAILGNDRPELEALLECKSTICCGIFPGKEDEDEEEPSKKDDDEILAQSSRAA